MQRMSAVVYRCFRTAYWSHIQGSRSPRRWTDRQSWTISMHIPRCCI